MHTTDLKISENLIVGSSSDLRGNVDVGGDVDVSGILKYTAAEIGAPVDVTDAATYTALAANSGRIHIIPDGSQDIAVTLPTPKAGLYFKFIYGGVAADATGVSIATGSASVFLEGNVLGLDTDNSTPTVYAPVFANGTSNTKITVDTPDAIELNFLGISATKYKIWGSYGSVATAVVADS